MRVVYLIFIGVLLVTLVGCASEQKSIEEGRTMLLTNKGTTTCQLIEKPFIIKNGVESDIMELYLRCSVQDYFIKLCESNVSAKQLRKYLDKGITIEMEIKEGQWDQCEENQELQSRIGTYVIITSIE